MIMNFYERAGELLPHIMVWNSEIKQFFARDPESKGLAVTY
jgi:hypothetical protein